MNYFTLNSGSLNGAVRGLVMATAAIVCASTVNAASVRIAQGTATVDAQASVTSDLTYNHTTTQTNITGYGGLFPNAKHIQAASSQLSGSTDLVAYVLRSVASAATVNASAELTVVVASYQGTVNIGGTGIVVPSATRIQAAYSNAEGFASVALTAEPTLYRMHSVNIAGQALLRTEPSLKVFPLTFTEHTSYFDAVSFAEITANALCYREAYAEVSGQVITLATGTLQQPAFAEPFSNAVVLLASSYIKTSLGSNINCSANLTADPLLKKVAEGSITGSVSLQVNPAQNHKGFALASAAASLVPLAFTTLPAYSIGSATVVITAQATILKVGQVALVTSSTFIPEAVRTTYGLTEYTGNLVIVVLPAVTVRYVEAVLQGDVNITSFGGISQITSSNVLCGANIDSNATRLTFVTSLEPVNFIGTSEMYADTVANPESYDPFERTFIRPVDVVEFARPYIETEFRRAYEVGYDLQATR